jgi:transposase-like protein
MTGRRIDPAEAVRLYNDEQMTIRQIAKKIGVSYGSVHRTLSERTTLRPRGGPQRGRGGSRAYNRALRRLAGEFPDIFGPLRAEEEDRARNEREGEATHTWKHRALERAHRRLAKLRPARFAAILAEEKQKAAAGKRKEVKPMSNDATDDGPAGRLAAARIDLVDAAGRCAGFGAQLDPERLPDFGDADAVTAALKALNVALEPGGDVASVETAARGVAAAVTTSVKDLAMRGLDDPGLAFLGAMITLRRRLLAVDTAAADLEAAERRNTGDEGATQ